MEATVRVLTRNGCDVVVPNGQGCCGALNTHAGDLYNSRTMARTNIDSLMAAGVEKIITSSAGCGSSMKEYSELLKDDPEYKEKAAQFSEMTQDVTEFLVNLPFRPPTSTINRQVTYHPWLESRGNGKLHAMLWRCRDLFFGSTFPIKAPSQTQNRYHQRH